MAERSVRVDSADKSTCHGDVHRRRSGNQQGRKATVLEYEVRLYQPYDRRALVFTRTPSAASAASLARRWQVARPECRVSVVETRRPRPRALPSE
jgi:hypothetical protein